VRVSNAFYNLSLILPNRNNRNCFEKVRVIPGNGITQFEINPKPTVGIKFSLGKDECESYQPGICKAVIPAPAPQKCVDDFHSAPTGKMLKLCISLINA
jgi:hypothetical protein